jgi:hypothetical protein
VAPELGQVSSNPASSDEGFHGEKVNREDRGEREGWGACGCFLSHCQMGHERTCADGKARPRLSGSPQKPRKFDPVLGRSGRGSCPLLV